MAAAGVASARTHWRRDKETWVALGVLIVSCWTYLALMQTDAVDVMCQSSARIGHHGVGELLSAVAMWSVMMAAMMLPTAIPATALFITLSSRRSPTRDARFFGTFYVLGYLFVWMGYSVLAALAQWGLLHFQMLNQTTLAADKALSVSVLLIAGAFQFTSLKEACLSKCRTPFSFFLAEWRDGLYGAFFVGVRHGAFCVACCWALMAVMFVVGTMNVFWMGILSIGVLLEKLAPRGWHISQLSGFALFIWAAWIIFQ